MFFFPSDESLQSSEYLLDYRLIPYVQIPGETTLRSPLPLAFLSEHASLIEILVKPGYEGNDGLSCLRRDVVGDVNLVEVLDSRTLIISMNRLQFLFFTRIRLYLASFL